MIASGRPQTQGRLGLYIRSPVRIEKLEHER